MTGAFVKSVATKDRLNAVRGANGLKAKVKAGLTDDGVDDVAYGMTMWFRVTVEDKENTISLGEWSTCSGLGLDIDVEVVDEGIQHAEPKLLPKTVKYKQITLQRAVSTADSERIRGWLQQVVDKWVLSDNGAAPGHSGEYAGASISIELFGAPLGKGDGAGIPIRTWALIGAYPVSWAGPGLNASSGQIATESLTLAHRGFEKDGAKKGTGGPAKDNSTGEQLLVSLASKLDASRKLKIQFQPDKITMDKSSIHKTGDVSTIADPGKASFTFTIRVEGVEAVRQNRSVLFEWIDKNSVVTVTNADGKKQDERDFEPLMLCIGRESAGGIERTVWLRSVGTAFTRFTTKGVPSRATFTLTVEEVPKVWKPAGPTAKDPARANAAKAGSGDPIRLARHRPAGKP